MTTSLEALGREPGRAVVMDGTAGSEIIGLVSTTDLSRALQNSTREGRPPGSRRRTGRLISLTVTVVTLLAVAAIYYPPFAVVEPGEIGVGSERVGLAAAGGAGDGRVEVSRRPSSRLASTWRVV